MFDELIREMMRLGFSDKESTVYVTLLRRGNASVADICTETGMNRATVHDTCDHLGRAGLVTAYAADGQRRFGAEPPERLLTVLSLQRREVTAREDIAARLLPRLLAIGTSHAAKPKIRYIEGIDGLRNMQREYECQEGDVIQLVGYDAYRAVEDRRMTRSHHETIATNKKNRVRAIVVTDADVAFLKFYEGVECRRISPALIDVQGEVTVWHDRVTLFSFANGIIAIEITSKTIADTLRGVLELAWFAAEKLKTN